jgi:PAS domain S-box-containing protein
MFTDRNDTLNTRRTVVAYAAAGVLVVGLVNLLLAALGLDDGSPADLVRGLSFIALTSLLLWLLLNRKRRRLEALRKRAEIQQALAGQSNDVLMLEDDTGLIVTVNRRAAETYGRSAAALLGSKTRDLRSPEARAAADAARSRLQVDGVAYFTTEHVTADGRRFPVEESSRIVEIDGRRYVHTSVRDLTDVVRERDLLRLFYDLPFVGMTVIAADGLQITSVNDEFCRMLGYTRAEFLGRKWPEFFDQQFVETTMGLQRQLGSGEIDRVLTETRQQRKDGAIVDVRLDMRCSRRADGRPDLFLAMARDVTLRNRTFLELQQAHRHLRSIIDASDSFIWLCDTESRCLLINERLAGVLGGRPRDFVGRLRQEFLPAQDAADHVLNDRKVLDSGEPLTVEERLHHGNDERLVLSVKFPVRDSQGRIYAIGGIATDITALREAESIVAESERKYRLLFESNPNPMWVYEHATLRILAVNNAAVVKYGYSRDEFLTLSITDLRLPEDLPPLREALARIGEGYDESGPWRHRRKDGSSILVYIISHVINFEGRKARIVLPIDITQRLEAETAARESAEKLKQLNLELERRVAVRTTELVRAKDRAEAADRVKSVFLASMSHELRTPLNSIIGFSEVLLSQADGPLSEPQQRQLAIVQDAGRHLLSLISDVLDISRIEAGALSLRVENVDLCAIVRDEAELHSHAAQTRGLAFAMHGCTGEVWVRADARRTRQVVGNLLSNAVKFTDAGSITLLLEVEGETARVTVEDTGIGIERTHLGEIFEPFRRVEAAGAQLRDGTGLGLSIVLRLLEAMGGHLGVESEPGRGSRFWFTLPLAHSRVTVPARLTRDEHTSDVVSRLS